MIAHKAIQKKKREKRKEKRNIVFVCFFDNVQLPNNNQNDTNNKNFNTNTMWKDHIDSPQVSIGGGFRVVSIGSLSQRDCMAFEESFDNGNVRDCCTCLI